jgi:NAD(P)-dependent dehydrogenase (short-subunit alcohol dehydrogenase family)
MSKARRVLVTGATGLLGQAIAGHLAERGWNVVVTSRDASRAQDLANDLARGSGKISGIDLDLTDQVSIESLPDRMIGLGLSVTHLVNNARLLDALAVAADGTTSATHFHTELDVDVVQPYRLTMALAHHPDHALAGVVNIGSQYGSVAPNPALYGGTLARNPVQYGTAKAALHHLTRELAVRLAPDTRVNCVAFGGVAGRADADFVARYSSMVPAGRMLDPAEAGGPVAFLLDDGSSAVNGHVLVADGGWTAW